MRSHFIRFEVERIFLPETSSAGAVFLRGGVDDLCVIFKENTLVFSEKCENTNSPMFMKEQSRGNPDFRFAR